MVDSKVIYNYLNNQINHNNEPRRKLATVTGPFPQFEKHESDVKLVDGQWY